MMIGPEFVFQGVVTNTIYYEYGGCFLWLNGISQMMFWEL
jgi:hypothetical protein